MEPEGDFISERGLLLACSGNESASAEGVTGSKSEEIALEKTSQDVSETDGTVSFSDDSAILPPRGGKKKRNRRRNKKGRRPDTAEEQYQNLDSHEVHSEVLLPGSRTESADELDPTTPSISPTSQTPSPSEASLAVPPKHLDSHEDYVKQDGTYVLNYEKHALEVGEQLKSLEVEWSKGQGIPKNLSPSGRTIPCAPNPSIAEFGISDGVEIEKASDSLTEIPIDELLAAQTMDMNENLMYDVQRALHPRDVDLPVDDSFDAQNSGAEEFLEDRVLEHRSATEPEVESDGHTTDTESDVSDATQYRNLDTDNDELLNYLSASAAEILKAQFRSTTEIVEVGDDVPNDDIKPKEAVSDDILGNNIIVEEDILDDYIVDSPRACDGRLDDDVLNSCILCDDILDDYIVGACGVRDDISDSYIVDETGLDDDDIVSGAVVNGDEVQDDVLNLDKADTPKEKGTEAQKPIEPDEFPGNQNLGNIDATPNEKFQHKSPRFAETLETELRKYDDHYSGASDHTEDRSFDYEDLVKVDDPNDDCYDLTDVSTCGSEVGQSDDYLYDMLEGQDSCLTVVPSGTLLHSDLSQADDVPSEEFLNSKELSVTEIRVENLLNVPSPSEADILSHEEFEPLNQDGGLSGIDGVHQEFVPNEASVIYTEKFRSTSGSPSPRPVNLQEFKHDQLSNVYQVLNNGISDTEVSSEDHIPIENETELSESQPQLPVLHLHATDNISTWKNNNPEHVQYLYNVVDGIIVTAMDKVSEIEIQELLNEDKPEGSVSKEILDEFEEQTSAESKSDSMNNLLVVKGQEDYDDVYPNEYQPNYEIHASTSVHDSHGFPVFPLEVKPVALTNEDASEETIDAELLNFGPEDTGEETVDTEPLHFGPEETSEEQVDAEPLNFGPEDTSEETVDSEPVTLTPEVTAEQDSEFRDYQHIQMRPAQIPYPFPTFKKSSTPKRSEDLIAEQAASLKAFYDKHDKDHGLRHGQGFPIEELIENKEYLPFGPPLRRKNFYILGDKLFKGVCDSTPSMVQNPETEESITLPGEESAKPVRISAAERAAIWGEKVQTDSRIPDDQDAEELENAKIPEVLSSDVVKDPYLSTRSQIEPGTLPDPITTMIVGETGSQFLYESSSEPHFENGKHSDSKESFGISTKSSTAPRGSRATKAFGKAQQTAETFPRRSKVDDVHDRLNGNVGSRARRASLGRRVLNGIRDVVGPIVIPCFRGVANDDPEDIPSSYPPVLVIKKSASSSTLEDLVPSQSAKPEEPAKKFGSLRRMMNRK